LISKQVLLADLQARGFDTHLVNLKDGHDAVEYGNLVWGDTELTKVYLGRWLTDLDPQAYHVWGITNNFSQHREVARLTIQHLASQGRPVVVGGSDAIAEPQCYLQAGATAVVLDKSGAANGSILEYVLGHTPREELSGVMLADGKVLPKRGQALSPED
jgi:hypothetical protein